MPRGVTPPELPALGTPRPLRTLGGGDARRAAAALLLGASVRGVLRWADTARRGVRATLLAAGTSRSAGCDGGPPPLPHCSMDPDPRAGSPPVARGVRPPAAPMAEEVGPPSVVHRGDAAPREDGADEAGAPTPADALRGDTRPEEAALPRGVMAPRREERPKGVPPLAGVPPLPRDDRPPLVSPPYMPLPSTRLGLAARTRDVVAAAAAAAVADTLLTPPTSGDISGRMLEPAAAVPTGVTMGATPYRCAVREAAAAAAAAVAAANDGDGAAAATRWVSDPPPPLGSM